MVAGNRLFFAVFVLFLLAVAVLHFWQLGKSDVYFDESNHALAARLFVEDGVSIYHTAILRPPLYDYFVSAAYVIFGVNNFGLRIFSAFAGVLGIVGVYLVSRLYFGRRVSLSAAMVFSVIPLAVVYGRVGFGDLMFVSFALFVVYFFERFLRSSCRRFFFFACVAFALSFLSKFSALVVVAFYCVFLVAEPVFRRDFRLLVKRVFLCGLLYAVSGALVVVFVALTGGFGRVLQMVHNFIVQYAIQASSVEYSRFYHFAAFVGWLSPLVYVLLVLSFVLFVFRFRSQSRGSWLVWWLLLSNLLLLTVLPRKAVNHFVPLLPFIAVVCAHGFFEFGRIVRFKVLLAVFGVFVLLSAFGWSVYSVSGMQSYTHLGDVADFVSSSYPGRVVHVILRDYPAVSMMANASVKSSMRFDFDNLVPEKGSLVVLPVSGDGLDRSLGRHVLISNKFGSNVSSPEFRSYVKGNGKLVFTAYYSGVKAIEVYEVLFESLRPRHVEGASSLIEPAPVKMLWGFLCRAYGINAARPIIERSFSSDLVGSVRGRCVWSQ